MNEIYNKNIYGKYDEETIAKQNAWEAAWDNEKKEKAKVVAEYYIANPPYFSQVANKILNDPNFIPPEKQYKKMTENKYTLTLTADEALLLEYSIKKMGGAGEVVLALMAKATQLADSVLTENAIKEQER